MLKFMYIDESGDLGQKGSKYLILSCLLIDDPAKLSRIIKNMRRNKFKKQLKKATEIKANNSSSDLIKYMINKLNNIKNAKIFFVVLEKKKIFSDFLRNDKHKLYNFVAGKLASQIVLHDIDVEVRIDKSKGKQLLRDDFNDYFIKRLNEKSSIRKITIFHSYSHSWSGIQFADILAWSCFQKFCKDDSSYLDLIEIDREIYHVW